jgi:hypothetical protein
VVVGAGGEFSITRAIMAELYPLGARLRHDGDDPEGFRQKAGQQLGLDPAEDKRWETAAEFWCPAELLDVVLYDYSQWRLRLQDGPGEEPVGDWGESSWHHRELRPGRCQTRHLLAADPCSSGWLA